MPRYLRGMIIEARRGLFGIGLFTAAVLASGCTGKISASNTSQVQTPNGQSFAISGTLSPTTGGGGATVSLSGASSATTTANGTGAYTFGGLAAGSYAVTPSAPGFTFNPTSQTATVTVADITGINFAATAHKGSSFSISGTISPTTGGSGATVLLSGVAGATTTTNAAGNYTFTGLANGNYTVLPINSGFAYTPSSRNVSINGASDTSVNFTAAVGQPHTVALTWNSSSSTVSGYNVYRSTVNGSGYTRLNSSLVNGLGYADTTVQSGTTYFYVATAVDSGGDESADSNQATAVIP